MMYFVFQDKVKPLFCWDDDNIYNCVNMDTIYNLLGRDSIKELRYTECKLKDADRGHISVLTRLINGEVDGIISVNENSYRLSSIKEALESENTVDGRTYKIYDFSGTIE